MMRMALDSQGLVTIFSQMGQLAGSGSDSGTIASCPVPGMFGAGGHVDVGWPVRLSFSCIVAPSKRSFSCFSTPVNC